MASVGMQQACSCSKTANLSSTKQCVVSRRVPVAMPVRYTSMGSAGLVGSRISHLPLKPSDRSVSWRASGNGATATAGASSVPKPVVKIDNMSDPFATVVSVEFGDRLGELLDTITALKNLGLNIRKAKVSSGGKKINTFYITDAETSEKILKSKRLEEIRLTIINNMLYYHPESSEALAAGKPFQPPSRDPTAPLGYKARAVVQTTIEVEEAPNGSCSILRVTTSDRPGLLVDVVSVLKDINVNVVSAEIDTFGDEAKDEFFVTYHGEPLNGPMVQLVTNSLQYYLSLSEVAKEESY